MEFRIRKHFCPSLTSFCLHYHPFAKGLEATRFLAHSHTKFNYMSLVLVFKIGAQLQTFVSISPSLYKFKSPYYCHHYIGFSPLLSSIYSVNSSQSNPLNRKMAHIMPLLITIQWLPLEIYGAAPPYLSCIGSFQSLSCFSCFISLTSPCSERNAKPLPGFPIFYLEQFSSLSFCTLVFFPHLLRF